MSADFTHAAETPVPTANTPTDLPDVLKEVKAAIGAYVFAGSYQYASLMHADREELVSETLLAVVKAIKKKKIPATVEDARRWAFQVLKRRYADYRRKCARRARRGITSLDIEGAPVPAARVADPSTALENEDLARWLRGRLLQVAETPDEVALAQFIIEEMNQGRFPTLERMASAVRPSKEDGLRQFGDRIFAKLVRRIAGRDKHTPSKAG